MGRLLTLLALVTLPGAAAAHGFGRRYDLPLPLDLFVFGGGAAVALSFVVAAAFLRHRPEPGLYPTVNLYRTAVGRVLAHPVVLATVRAAAAVLFVLTVLAGYIGAPSPYENLSVVMVWVIAWVGTAFVTALLGNVWALVNPWAILFSWAERAYAALRPGRRLARHVAYPEDWGTWPAFVLFFLFAWIEINWPGSGVPRNVAVMLTVYSLVTWTGMAVFGREVWLKHGEAFAVVFALFARFAVTEVRVRGRDDTSSSEREWNLRPPAVGLATDETPSPSYMVFVLLVLATVTYDGFTETELFQRIAYDLFYRLQWMGATAVRVVSTIGLASFPLIFFAVYMLFAALVRVVGRTPVPLIEVAARFVLTIVPIAIAYHLAHYLSLLVYEGQTVIALVSDPFGFGWDLLGTADYQIDITVMSAWFVWYFSVATIVLGHIAAVYLAHGEALRLFGDRRRALSSQIPMLALMVGYTMISLWIIAQPIVS